MDSLKIMSRHVLQVAAVLQLLPHTSIARDAYAERRSRVAQLSVEAICDGGRVGSLLFLIYWDQLD